MTLCPNDQLNSTVVRVTEFNWLSIAAPAEPLHAAAKIRYNMHQAPCTVEVLPGGDVQLTFDTPQRAVTRSGCRCLCRRHGTGRRTHCVTAIYRFNLLKNFVDKARLQCYNFHTVL